MQLLLSCPGGCCLHPSVSLEGAPANWKRRCIRTRPADSTVTSGLEWGRGAWLQEPHPRCPGS